MTDKDYTVPDFLDEESERKINGFVVDLLAFFHKHDTYMNGDDEYGGLYFSPISATGLSVNIGDYDRRNDCIPRLVISGDPTYKYNHPETIRFTDWASQFFAHDFSINEVAPNPSAMVFGSVNQGPLYTLSCTVFADGRVKYELSCEARAKSGAIRETRTKEL